MNENLCFGTILSEQACESLSVDFEIFILLHQMVGRKLSYLAQTCELARMALVLGIK